MCGQKKITGMLRWRVVAGFLAIISSSGTVVAETTECTVINSLPAIISAQGVYCLKGNLSSALAAGNLIDIQANNVTIDMNGYKLGGIAAGLSTLANGIFAENRKNITLLNGTIRGFRRGVWLRQNSGTSSGHILFDLRLENNRESGAVIAGNGNIIRNNQVINTGGATGETSVQGIHVASAFETLVEGNVVAGSFDGLNGAAGIRIDSSNTIQVRANTVFDTTSSVSTASGILAANSHSILIDANTIVNGGASAGDFAIRANNSITNYITCTNNLSLNFTTGEDVCDNSNGNQHF